MNTTKNVTDLKAGDTIVLGAEVHARVVSIEDDTVTYADAHVASGPEGSMHYGPGAVVLAVEP